MRSISGHKDYRVDDFGHIYSFKSGSFKKLKPRLSNKGYLRVRLREKGAYKELLVHRLVAMAFIKTKKGCQIINHKNSDKTDNRAENLEWCTHSQNSRHSVRANMNTRKGKPVEAIDNDGNVIKSFNSSVLAAKDAGVYPSVIRKAIATGANLNGIRWQLA